MIDMDGICFEIDILIIISSTKRDSLIHIMTSKDCCINIDVSNSISSIMTKFSFFNRIQARVQPFRKI